ncbi:MAG: hypothetical protein ACI4MU_05380 [Candidatus Ventricola sp.]
MYHDREKKESAAVQGTPDAMARLAGRERRIRGYQNVTSFTFDGRGVSKTAPKTEKQGGLADSTSNPDGHVGKNVKIVHKFISKFRKTGEIICLIWYNTIKKDIN